MESDVPTNCPKCGTPLLPRNVHRFGVAMGVEVAFGLVLLAFFVPVLWARVALAVPGLALLAFALASSRLVARGAAQIATQRSFRLLVAQMSNYVFKPTAIQILRFNQSLPRGGGLTRR
jgi:hypothetical protein